MLRFGLCIQSAWGAGSNSERAGRRQLGFLLRGVRLGLSREAEATVRNPALGAEPQGAGQLSPGMGPSSERAPLSPPPRPAPRPRHTLVPGRGRLWVPRGREGRAPIYSPARLLNRVWW